MIPDHRDTPTSAPIVPDEAIRAILTARIDAHRQSHGIVVGVIEPHGRRVVAHGRMGRDDPRPVETDTLFEIGSITKPFTALLLADMVARGELALDDPLAKYLPGGVDAPVRAGRTVTLADLATHTSGLPSLPDDFAPGDSGNPYADYTLAQLYGFLSRFVPATDIGTTFGYSNLGYGLLGQALAHRAGIGYAGLVAARITAPLGMTSTMIAVSGEAAERFAPAHGADLAPVAHWDLPTLAGAGALRSTTRDLMHFIEAALGYRESRLAEAFAAMLQLRRPTGLPGAAIGLGWMIEEIAGDTLVWHNGGTGGHRSFAGYRIKAGTGVVVLSNTSAQLGIDDIGRHLLDHRLPLTPPPKPRVAIAVAADRLEAHVGRYRFSPELILTVTREDARLYVQATGQPKIEIFAESPLAFFAREVDAQFVFEMDGTGRAGRLILHQGGGTAPAERLPEA
ncbi:serine hydrolase [Phreatobacter sp. AB_2022a]|uniref:serine hydrolase n=1 Tax=Phreatobacter sp. AB_2022a TaxID=3003134 RepID=UPI002286FEE0|nr:serine hydrolase [Phreatobacter sp. AB_2022a]MCZ0736620.1 serine hydrolase [Phreatobacter sp. AB_2022a]